MLSRLLFTLLLCFGALACAQQPITITDFSGGMNTSSNWTIVGKNQSQQMLNWVLDDPTGALTVRPGYIVVSGGTAAADTLPSKYGQYISLHSRRFSDGKAFLDAVVTLPDSGYAKIFRSVANTYYVVKGYETGIGWQEVRTQVTKLHPTRGTWVTFGGNDYYFNGRNRMQVLTRPKVYTEAAPVFPPAPGQPEAKPINLTGSLNGTYMYTILSEMPCSVLVSTAPKWADLPGVLSMPTLAIKEKIEISNFWPLTRDSGCTSFSDTVQVWFKILRTRGNSNNFDTDSLFVIDSILRPSKRADTILYTDTTGDATLTAGRYWGLIEHLSGPRSSRWPTPVYWDSAAREGNLCAPGQMGWLYTDSGSNADTVFADGSAFNSAAVLYTWALVDKQTGAPSDTAPSLIVTGDGADQTHENITLYVPPPPSKRYDRVLLRSNIGYRIPVYDTIDYGFELLSQPKRTLTELIERIKQASLLPRTRMRYSINSFDTWAPVFYVLDTLTDSTVTTYWDTTGWAELELQHGMYERRVPITHYSGAIVHEQRMFCWDDEGVYVSIPDTPMFAADDEFLFDDGSGEKVVGLSAFEGFIIVYMSNSTWVLYTRDGTIYDQRKISRGFGAVSPHTIVPYGGRQFVLGQRGVAEETGNVYRDNDVTRSLVSDPIRNILLRPVSSMAAATAGTYVDRILFSYPGSDSTFVLFGKTGGWGLWDFDMLASCLYDSSSVPGVTPSEQFVFSRPNDKRLYALADTVYSDSAGLSYTAVWEKLNLSPNDLPQALSELTLLSTSTVADSVDLTLTIVSDRGDTLFAGSIDSLQTKFHRERMSAAANNVGHWFDITLTAPSAKKITINGLTLKSETAGTD